MSNLEEIKLAISSSLPGLSDEKLQKFIHGLSAIGVETKDDLRWQPEEFPVGENDDTLEEKRKQMVQMVLLHSTEGMSGANRGELHKLMEANSLVLCILKLLMADFKVRTESLLIEADAAATAANMEREGLPDSPALIIQGESMTPSKWMLSFEREVVLGPFSEAFVEGLAALFATYYNLNLAY
ncbi:hypothetical protein Q7C36_017224 [Tachysurus vachellii]|uniref:Uncharacterized protein n=1 Tax=Tachysurus vachellii TaxID=175792 RepID=A0AA88M2Y4_TACVA|nr:hypothetical protein Q7C36_017224 [Tachysurus vachellii]